MNQQSFMGLPARAVAYTVLVISALFTGHANAEVYKCKLESGRVEIRDFPCAATGRPTSPVPLPSQRPTTPQNQISSQPNSLRPSAANPISFATARSACMRLMEQHDLSSAVMRCNPNDTACFDRATQETSAIYKRMVSRPEWRQYQCDLVMDIEGGGTSSRGCNTAHIVEPSPFLGTANEVIVLSDGSTWKDISYKYLYLYAYSPTVQICPSQSKMILDHSGTKHTFSLMRMR